MAATMKYKTIDSDYDIISLDVPEGRKAMIKERAKSKGMSVSAYVSNLIEKDNAANGAF